MIEYIECKRSIKRSKHIALDFHFIWDLVDSKLLHVSYVSLVDQMADIFTKPLSKERMNLLRFKLQVRPNLLLEGG